MTDPLLTMPLTDVLCTAPTSLPEEFGTCWVLPRTAPSEAGPNNLQQIGPPPSCLLSKCMNPYESLQTSGVFIEDGNCPP